MEYIGKENVVNKIENWLKGYVMFAEEFYSLPVALWVIATHAWQNFDAFPYMCISARTKKAGKTTFKNCLVPLVPNGKKYSVSSVSSMFQDLGIDNDENGQADISKFPVMFIDECEALISETHPAREFLNKGFERGEKITRSKGEYECYCPKAFVGIGGVYDTLKDRSIMIMMKRRSPVEALKYKRVRQTVVDMEAGELRGEAKTMVAEHIEEIRAQYADTSAMLEFLDERAEKCWLPLFIMARIFCPERIEELTKIAVDMEADKDAPQLKAHGDEWEAAEKQAGDEEARVILLRDMIAIMGKDGAVSSVDVVDRLKEITTSGWRRFRGRGLTAIDMGYLLDPMNIHPKVIRIKGQPKVVRGYKRADLIAAATLAGLIENE